ncbi:MAG: hypothetical protein WAK48_09620 [Candidatus Acidiferrum sp.]|jgi:hypothetical protein
MRRVPFCVLPFVLIHIFLGGCGGGGSSSSPPPQVSVSVSPIAATVAAGGTQQFGASVTGTSNTAVTWSVAGGVLNGAISATGLYTAPSVVPNPAQVTVTATSHADPSASGTAAVAITGIGVQVLPPTVTLQTLGMQTFSANVTGTTNTAVTWSVVGGSGNGSITQSGSYTAPATVPNPAQVTVMATSQADTTKSGTAIVTVIAATPSITVSPNPAATSVFTTVQFAAFPSNLSNNAVTWQVNGVTGGSQQTGYISSAGLFVAPAGVPTSFSGSGENTPTTVTVTAVSQSNPAVSGSAAVTINNFAAQNATSYFGSSGGNQKDSLTSGNETYCCSGTLGSLVTLGGTSYILSNNHVLARDDLGTITSGTTPGDDITQPGLIDSSCGQGIFDTIANLTQFYNLETGALPKIDAAIALPTGTGAMDAQGRIMYLGATTDENNIPIPAAPHAGSGLPETSALLGVAVTKSGRTTGLTCSSISSISTSVSVQYMKGCHSTTTFTVTFTDQILVAGGTFSAPGDSGSLIVTQDTADPVALLVAGSDEDTAGNPVGDVLNYFQSGSNTMTFVGSAAHQVIGCTLPTAPTSAVLTVPISSVSPQAMQKASEVLTAYASELLGRPQVRAVGLGASQDDPGEPAILVFVPKGATHSVIPPEVAGIRTRAVQGEVSGQLGILTTEQSAAFNQGAQAAPVSYPVSESEYARAKSVHTAHLDEWMSKPGIQGFGIGSSMDSPGEAALVIFAIRGVAREAIPPVIDGVRTRVRVSSRFIAGLHDEHRAGRCAAHTASSRERTRVTSTTRPD